MNSADCCLMRALHLSVCLSHRGLKAVDKRSGRGAHNWGNITDDVK